jgi:hypothetical protein
VWSRTTCYGYVCRKERLRVTISPVPSDRHERIARLAPGPDRLHSIDESLRELMRLQKMLGHRLAMPAGVVPRLEDRALLEALLPFASLTATLLEKLTAECYLRSGATDLTFVSVDPQRLQKLLQSRARRTHPDYIHENEFLNEVENWWEAVAADRRLYRQRLELVGGDRGGARRELGPVIGEAIARICPITRLEWDGQRVIRTEAFRSTDPHATLDYSLALLLDESKGFGEILRRCKWQDCRGFFLTRSGPAGGPRPIYCRSEHRVLAAGVTSPSRSAKYRERLRARQPKAVA